MTPMLARPATAAQATFEPDEEDEEAEDEDEEDGELPTLSPDFLSPVPEPVPDLSPDDEEDDESELTVLSVFLLSDPSDLLSDPFDAAAAGSALFWLERLSLR
jgi:hypothetical protein